MIREFYITYIGNDTIDREETTVCTLSELLCRLNDMEEHGCHSITASYMLDDDGANIDLEVQVWPR